MSDPILITGGAGYLGTALRRFVPRTGGLRAHYTYHETHPEPGAPDFHHLDIADDGSVLGLFERLHPTVVIHAAATMNPAHFERTIVEGSTTIARATNEIGAALVHLSSDMVFNGRQAPYDEGARPSPITDYGRAKTRAEEAVLRACPRAVIVRTSLLYSLVPIDPRTRRDISQLENGQRVVLFTDEKRSAAEVHDVAAAICALAVDLIGNRYDLAATADPSIVNIAGPESVTRWELGNALFAALGIPRHNLRASTIAESGMNRPRDLTLRREIPVPGGIRMRSLPQVLEEFATGQS